jgi:four helix bundle protein
MTRVGLGKPHHKLEAWQQSMALVTKVYEITKPFPPEELYGLTAQIRRSAVSIPSNIAEGAARKGQKEFAQFLSIAAGSISELETQLLIGVNLGMLRSDHEIFEALERVSKLVLGFCKSIQT